MQSYIYSYLFSRTLSDLDELLNIADDDRKDCLWEVRKRLLTAKTGPPETTRTSEVAPKGPVEKVTPKFQENCKDSVKVGAAFGFHPVQSYYVPAGPCTIASVTMNGKTYTPEEWAALGNPLTIMETEKIAGPLSTPPHQDVAPSHRILFAGPGECLVCSTCLTRITDNDVAAMASNHEAEAYWCARCEDFMEVRIRRLSTEEELEIEALRLRKEWEEDKQKRDVYAAAITAGRLTATIIDSLIAGDRKRVTHRNFPEGPELDMIPVCNV